jgi:ribonuclease VapC
MIAVDTSALLAVALDEPRAFDCAAALQSDDLIVSAMTVAEALVVASRRGVSNQLRALLDGLDFTVDSISQATSERIARIYDLWGKGMHPAALNLGDCFAYDVAKQRGCKLLYVGEDFAKTDIESVL